MFYKAFSRNRADRVRYPQSAGKVVSMRLRIFDLNTPWFWLTVFFQRTYGKPWLEASLWNPHTFKKWWVYAWLWEELPDERGGYSPETSHKQTTGVSGRDPVEPIS